MKNLASLVFGLILFAAACGSVGPAANGGGGGQAGSAAGAAGSGGGTSGAAGSAGGRGGGTDVGGSTGAAGAGATAGTGGGAGSTGGGGAGAACSTATTEAACNALADCHPVYTAEPRTPIGTCTCPDFGCCSRFSSCASGAHATCAGTVLCKVATPYCETGYSVETNGTCYVGCVMSSVCAP